MADQIREIYKKVRARSAEMRALARLAIWGFVAATALMGAVLSSYSTTGSQKVEVAVAAPASPGQPSAQRKNPTPPPASSQGPATAVTPTARRPDPATKPAPAAQTATYSPEAVVTTEVAKDIRRLSDALDALSGDRDLLIKRIAAIELNLEDLTGSIKRQAAAAAATAPAAAATSPPPAPPPAPSPATTDRTVVLSLLPPQPHQNPAPPGDAAAIARTEAAAPPPPPDPRLTNRGASTPAIQATDVETTRGGEFGIDIGGAVNFEGLRALWTSTQRAKGVSFEGMRPIIAVRETKARGLDLRLIVGPLPSTQAATQTCAALLAARRYCQMTSFEGQPLPLTATPEPAQTRNPTPARTQPARP